MYKLKSAAPFAPWARIWITDDGCFTAISDYGNFGYWWGSPGSEFRKFLISADAGYVENKLADGRKEIDALATSDTVKREILDRRRRKTITRVCARSEWDLMLSVDWESECERCGWYFNATSLGEMEDVLRYTPPRQLQAFMKNLWPLFLDQLRAELATESQSTQAAPDA